MSDKILQNITAYVDGELNNLEEQNTQKLILEDENYLNEYNIQKSVKNILMGKNFKKTIPNKTKNKIIDLLKSETIL